MARLHIFHESNSRLEPDMLLDYFSVYQRLHQITGPQLGRYPYMSDHLSDCINLASDIYIQLEKAIYKFATEYPLKQKVWDDDEEGYGIYWF